MWTVEWDTYHHLEEERAKFGYMSVSQTGILLCSGDSSGTQCLNMAIFDFLFFFPPLIYDDFSFALLSPKKSPFYTSQGNFILFYFLRLQRRCEISSPKQKNKNNGSQWFFWGASIVSISFWVMDQSNWLVPLPKKKIEKSNWTWDVPHLINRRGE